MKGWGRGDRNMESFFKGFFCIFFLNYLCFERAILKFVPGFEVLLLSFPLFYFLSIDKI